MEEQVEGTMQEPESTAAVPETENVIPDEAPDEAEPTDGTEQEEEPAETEPADEPKKHKKNGIWRVCAWILAVLLLLAGLFFGALFYLTRNITVNLDETPHFFALDNPLLSRITTCALDPADIDTSEPGVTAVPLTIAGFFTRTVSVEAKDLAGPVLTVRSVTAMDGAELVPEDFILACEDRSPVEYQPLHIGPQNESGTSVVRVAAVDANGNRTETGAELTTLPADDVPAVELNGPKKEAVAALREAYPMCETFSYGQIDMREAGRYTVTGTSGETRYRVFLDVTDTTPPTGISVDLNVRVGDDLNPEEFVRNVSDASDVTVSFAEEPDMNTAGEQTVEILLTDAAGNQTSLTSSLRVWLLPEILACEYGTESDWLTKQLKLYASVSGFGASPLEPEEVVDCAELRPGSYPLTLVGDGEPMPFVLIVEGGDSYPEGKAVSHDLIRGATLTADDFVIHKDDDDMVTCAFDGEPDFTAGEVQRVSVILSDLVGNSRTLTGRLMVWDIPTSIRVPYGTSNNKLITELFGNLDGDYTPRLPDGFDCAYLTPGEHDVAFMGFYETITVHIDVTDDVPPAVTIQPVTICAGQTVMPGDFIVSAADASPFETVFADEPDTVSVHTETVRLITTDAFGNSTESTSALTVIEDTIPPQIGGVSTIYATAGDTISYRSNVWAVDNVDGTIAVSVDASQVDGKTAGTYAVEYSAEDSAGNRASVWADVIVQPTDEERVAELADAVLASILTDGMTDYEKAYAVYSWCRSNISYSSATAYLMEQFTKAAYTGLTGYYGNCYVYYAVTSTLLTRCGIENMKIQRSGENVSPHYWNLVNIDGNWYHMDACPHYAAYPLDSFLLTDRQVADYSLYGAVGYYNFDNSLYPATP